MELDKGLPSQIRDEIHGELTPSSLMYPINGWEGRFSGGKRVLGKSVIKSVDNCEEGAAKSQGDWAGMSRRTWATLDG